MNKIKLLTFFTLIFCMQQLQAAVESKDDYENERQAIIDAVLQSQRPLNSPFQDFLEQRIPQSLNDDINMQCSNGWTYLNFAVVFNKKDLIKLLITKGADVNIPGFHGDTSLHIAARINNKETMQVLISACLNLNIQNDCGETPLFVAVDNNHTEIMQLLIDAGADVNIQNNKGQTPLHVKAFYNNKEVVQLLIDAGADMSIQNNCGETAEQGACTHEMRDLFAQQKQKARTMAILQNQNSCVARNLCIIS